MVTGFDIIGSNKALQEHWIKRLIASIVDFIIVLIPLWIVHSILFWAVFAGWGWWFGWFWWMFDGLFLFLYFLVLEIAMHSSIGKKIMNLQVVTTTGQPLGVGAIVIRNLFKILYPLLWLDVILGLFTQGDPRQKFMDRIANTTVVRTDAQAYVEEQFRQMQMVPPHPQVAPGAWGAPPQPGQQPYPGAQQQPMQQPMQQQPPGGWGQQPGAWSPSPQPPQGQWPQHQWDEKGDLKPPARFCSSCGGQLTPRGDGKLVCVRCGLVF